MPFYIVLNPHGIGDVRKEGTYIGQKNQKIALTLKVPNNLENFSKHALIEPSLSILLSFLFCEMGRRQLPKQIKI